MMPNVSYKEVSEADFEELAGIRVAAMRESLERLGRFDPARSRERLRSSFVPGSTQFIGVDGARVGFYATREMMDGLWLDHLYILPDWQGRGIGGVVLHSILAAADARGLAVRLGALKESASNRFYQRHGFVLEREDEWDCYYVRPSVRSGD
jgi:GNAT superfamily N-acetyltransferase